MMEAMPKEVRTADGPVGATEPRSALGSHAASYAPKRAAPPLHVAENPEQLL